MLHLSTLFGWNCESPFCSSAPSSERTGHFPFVATVTLVSCLLYFRINRLTLLPNLYLYFLKIIFLLGPSCSFYMYVSLPEAWRLLQPLQRVLWGEMLLRDSPLGISAFSQIKEEVKRLRMRRKNNQYDELKIKKNMFLKIKKNGWTPWSWG